MTDLDWPIWMDRTKAKNRERNNHFGATLAQSAKDLATEMERLDPDDWRASTASGGAHTRSNGLPKHSANPDDPGFVLRWSKDGEQFAVACDDSPRLRDNVRTVYKWINETRLRNQRPVKTGEDEFAAARLPSGDESDAVVAQRPPHKVLGVERDAGRDEIKRAFRQKIKEAHPDNGGSEQEFKRLKNAKEAMLDG